MIRTGQDYRAAIRDGREVHLDGAPVGDVTTHPAFRPLVDLRARIFDMAHDPATAPILTVRTGDEVNVLANALPFSQSDWWAKRRATEAMLGAAGGPVARIGDETVGEIWSLHDCAAVLNEIDPQYAPNIAAHIARVTRADPFHVSANADPARAPGDAGLRLHVVRETDAGLVVRGAKYETAAAYAEQAFTKPTIGGWGDAETSAHAVGFICDLSARGLKFICRSALGGRAGAEDYPLSNRLDEIDTLLIFDDVLIPWEYVLFHRHTASALAMRATLHRYSAFAFVQRSLKLADLMIGAALFSLRQSGLDRVEGVQEKLAQLACWREGIDAHLTASIAMADPPPLHAAIRQHRPERLHLARSLQRLVFGGRVDPQLGHDVGLAGLGDRGDGGHGVRRHHRHLAAIALLHHEFRHPRHDPRRGPVHLRDADLAAGQCRLRGAHRAKHRRSNADSDFHCVLPVAGFAPFVRGRRMSRHHWL